MTDGAGAARRGSSSRKRTSPSPQPAAFISLPAFPLGVDSVRLQRVVSAMTRLDLLPPNTKFEVSSMIGG